MTDDPTIRYIGASTRMAMAGHYSNHGAEFGYKVGRRVIGEVAACIAENHSREDAVELLYRVGDRVAAGVQPGVHILPGEELMPGPRAVVERLAEPEPEPEPDRPSIVFDFEAGIVTIEGIEPAEALKRLSYAADYLQRQIDAELPPWRRRLVRFWRETPGWFIGFVAALLISTVLR